MPNLAPLWEGYRRWWDPRNALPVTRGTGVEPVVVAPFPQGVLQQRAELLLAGSWADVTPYVYARDAVTIVRGRADEESAVNAGSCRFTVDNRDGRWSTRNPAGAWYGTLGRNTGYRHSVNVGLSRLWFPGVPVAGDHASCPDTAALSITGDLDLRIDCWNPSWRKSTNLLFKSDSVTPEDTSEVSYGLILGSTGLLSLYWSPDGTPGAAVVVRSSVPVPYPDNGRRAIRATLDVNNGAAGNTVTFYTAPTMSDTWVQLGDPVITAYVATVYNGSARLTIGTTSGSMSALAVYAAQVRSGIGGTLVADVDFTGQSGDVSGLVDSTGNGWSVAGQSRITSWRTRFTGEISAFPIRWDTSGSDVYAPLEASGVLRRLQQGATPVRSALYRSTLSNGTGLVAYWPMEDGVNATTLGSANGGPAMGVDGAAIAYADSEVFDCSAALPTFSTAVLAGTVPLYAATGMAQARWLISVPAAGLTNNAVILRTVGTGTAVRWEVIYGTGGTLAVKAYDSGGATILTTGAIAFNVNGTDSMMTLLLTQSGADINWELDQYPVGATVISATSGTLVGYTVGAIRKVTVNPGANVGTVVMGHVAVLSTTVQTGDLFAAVDAYLGEQASARVERLCGEEGIPYRLIGDGGSTVQLGIQTRQNLVDLLREAAEADGGVLFEARDMAGFVYRAGHSFACQTPGLALDYSAAQLDGLDPVDDDQAVRNDVTVSREGGGETRIVRATGPLGTGTVGVYDTSLSLSLASDGLALDQASWRVHVGTVDEARYPVLPFRLENARISASPTLTRTAVDLDVGDRVTVDSPPAWLPPDQISQLAQGFTETLTSFGVAVTVNLSPESPHHTAVYGTSVGDAAESRWSSDGSTLGVGVDATETVLSVATSTGPLWTTVPARFPMAGRLRGERVTVTAVAGTTSPQAFTVVRSVNGVTLTHPAGTTFELWRPVYYATREGA